MEPILNTSQLKIGYPNHILFDELSLSLYAGKLVCLMGPNGVGKSTLIRTLAGIQNPLEGSVSGTGNTNVTVVLTDKISAGMMTVRELINFGRYPYLKWHLKMSKADEAALDKAINQAKINNLLDKPLHELSDGQMQMVMIARALAQDTPTMILDEPTAHLDLNNRVEIMNLLRQLANEQQKAVLVSTHELDLALQTADLVWLASEGKVEIGIPEDLVLSGAFDKVFQFKGFDLKTGKVKHDPFRNMGIKLIGEGATYLWTKNALERNGYYVDENSSIVVEVNERNYWELNMLNKNERFARLELLLGDLEMI